MKKLIILLLTVLCVSGCSADPEAKTAREWVKEALIEDYVGDDEVVFHFEEDYEIYAGGENLGNYIEWEGSYIAFLTVEVYDFDGFDKKYYAFIVWEDDGNIFNFLVKPNDQKISDEFIVDFEIVEQ